MTTGRTVGRIIFTIVSFTKKKVGTGVQNKVGVNHHPTPRQQNYFYITHGRRWELEGRVSDCNLESSAKVLHSSSMGQKYKEHENKDNTSTSFLLHKRTLISAIDLGFLITVPAR